MIDGFVSEEETLARWQASTEASAGFVRVPDFYQPLFQACHQVVAGELDPMHWEEVRQNVLAEADSILAGVEQRAGLLGPISEEAQLCLEDLDEHLSGIFAALEAMGAYLEDGQPETLDQGWMDLMTATAGVQEATRRLAGLE